MNPLNYYVKTLTEAAKNLGPIVLFIVIGYFLFLKLPFLLALKAHQKSKITNPENKDSDPLTPKEEKTQEGASKTNSLPPPKEQRPESPKEKIIPPTPDEALFRLKFGEVITKHELKRRYHLLLKEHHPDKLQTKSDKVKNRAETKAKEINAVYEKLKKRMSQKQ